MRNETRVRWACGAALALAMLTTAVVARQAPAAGKGDPEAAKIKNPVAMTPESIAVGKQKYTEFGCNTCHGQNGEGGMSPSITEDQGLPGPPDLIDDEWLHGGSDGELFKTITEGVPPYIMGPYKGRLSDTDIWSVINFLKSVRKKQ
jgi:mono/diheme cytochrome c family protein